MPPRPSARVLRDIKARQGVADNELSRRAYLYVARNQSLPAQVRYQAQLQLNTFGRYTRPTTVKNRCTATGRGRGVMGEFGLCRVSESVLFFYVPCSDWVCGGLQYQFRLKALAGELPGVHKASW
jgi:small subunit ribosomal protein S14